MLNLYLNQSCSIAPQASVDEWGTVTSSSSHSVRCRFQPSTKQLMRQDGQLIVARGRLYLDADIAITLTSLVTIGSTVYHVIQIDNYTALDGTTLYLIVWLA